MSVIFSQPIHRHMDRQDLSHNLLGEGSKRNCLTVSIVSILLIRHVDPVFYHVYHILNTVTQAPRHDESLIFDEFL